MSCRLIWVLWSMIGLVLVFFGVMFFVLFVLSVMLLFNVFDVDKGLIVGIFMFVYYLYVV